MEAFIRFIEAAAQKWFPYMVDSSLQLVLLFAFIGILTKLFRNQSARFLYLLWLIFFVKAILPPSIRIPGFFSTPDIFPMQKFPTVALPIVQTITEPHISLSYMGIAFLVWFLGMAGLFILFVVKNIRFHRKIIASHREIQLNLRIPIRKQVQIFASQEISSPFVMGLFSSRIYVPEHALTWPENELRAVIYHELAHIQRRDILVILLQNLIQLAYFFHPFVWIANIQAARYREKACDDFAIQAMRGSSSDYSKFLLNSLDRVVKWQAIPSLTNFFHPSRKFLFQRFEYILTRKEHAMNKLTWLHKIVFVGAMIFAIALSCEREKNIQQSLAPDWEEGNFALLKSGLVDSQLVDYDTPPMPAEGFEVLADYLNYPDYIKDFGTIINLKIKDNGEVAMIQYKMSPNSRLNQQYQVDEINRSNHRLSGMTRKIAWKPATKNGQPIDAWVSLPIHYDKKIVIDKIEPTEKIDDNPADLQAEFVPYDREPRPIGGFNAIRENLRYPELVRRAGIEGTVTLYVQIDEKGDVVNTRVIKSLGDNGCDEAAVEAIKNVKWIPAEADGKPVKVWISVPVRFKLSNGDENQIDEKKIKETFVPFDEEPTPVGGFTAVHENLRYPEIARKAGIEGAVLVYARIDENGDVADTKIMKSLGDNGCDEAAAEAIKKTKWNPAKQKGKPVAVWVTVPVRFKLAQEK